jgi:hypothetical protein
MINRKIVFVFITSLSILACNKDSDYPEVSGSITIESVTTGMTELKIGVKIDLTNNENIKKGGVYLYDEGMNPLETIELPDVSENGEYLVSINNLERKKSYNLCVFIIDKSSNELKSNMVLAAMKAFTITGGYHKNILNHNLDPGWGEWNGVMSGDSIFITGSYLNEIDGSSKLFLDSLSDVIHILKCTDNELVVTIDSTVNRKIDFYTFYKECKLYVKLNEDTVGKPFKLNVFPDRPVLEQCNVSSGSWVELGGGMGNDGLDSLFAGNVKCVPEGYRTYASRYYHQRWWQYYSINPELEGGTYTFIGYLNGYSDSLEVVIP